MRSLCNQDFESIEIVIINDGSKDLNDDLIIKKYLNDYNNITYIKIKKNIGTSIARKIGWREAGGEYIGFLDADDFAVPSAYSTLYEATCRAGADIAIGNFVATKIQGDVSVPLEFPASNTQRIFSGEEFFACQIKRRNIPFYPRIDWWNKIYRREILLAIDEGIPPIVRNEGTLSMIASLKSDRCVVVDAPLFLSNIRDGSVCRTFRDRNIDDTINSFIFFRSKVSELGFYEKYRDDIDSLFIFVIFNHNMQMILGLEKYKRDEKLDILYNKINENDFVRDKLNRHLVKYRNSDEIIAHAYLRRDRSYRFLSRIKETNLDKYKQGGNRVFSRKDKSNRDVISIVTVSRNVVKSGRSDFLKQAAVSVRAQACEHFDFEHLVIDGESDDSSDVIYSSLASENLIDYWVSEPDRGIFDAMNKASYFSIGNFCLFLNTDDYLLPSALHDMYIKIRETNADYVYADAIKVDENNNIVGKHVADMDKVFFGSPYCHQALMCRMEILQEFPFREDYSLTMWPFAFELMESKYKGVHLKKDVAAFRVGGASTVTEMEKFTKEQDRFKREELIPRIHLTHNEYEYVNHFFRRWNFKKYNIDRDDILRKLKQPRNEFERKFSKAAIKLLRDAEFFAAE